MTNIFHILFYQLAFFPVLYINSTAQDRVLEFLLSAMKHQAKACLTAERHLDIQGVGKMITQEGEDEDTEKKDEGEDENMDEKDEDEEVVEGQLVQN